MSFASLKRHFIKEIEKNSEENREEKWNKRKFGEK